MSTNQSFIKSLNKLAKSFKDNVEDIDQTAQDIEQLIDSLMNRGEDISEMDLLKDMKGSLNDFLDDFDVDDIFANFDLEEQLNKIIDENIKPELEKFGITLDNFPPDPSSILSAVPDLIPDRIQTDFPNLKSQLQEIVDIISSEDIRISFKNVSKAVPPNTKTSEVKHFGSRSNQASSEPINRTASSVSPGKDIEKFLSEFVADNEAYFEEVINKLEELVMGAGIFLEIQEKIEPLLEKITSGKISDSDFQKEIIGDVAGLIKNLASGALTLVRDLVDFLFDEMDKIFGIIQNVFYETPRNLANANTLKTPNDFISNLLRTLIPGDRSLNLLTLPALTLSAPYTLGSKLINPQGPSQAERESIFNSGTGYGIVQLTKGVLALVEVGNISAFSNEKMKTLKDRISLTLSILDIVANLVAQGVSYGPAIKSLENAKSEGEHVRANFAIWCYQWGSSIIWPCFKIIADKKKWLSDKIMVFGDLILETIHLSMFIYINATAKDLDPRLQAANIIDPLPGIGGAFFSFISIELQSKILTLEQVLGIVNPAIVRLKAILDDAIVSPNTNKIRETFTILESTKPEVIRYLNTTLGQAIVLLQDLYNNHEIFRDPNLTDILPNLKHQLVSDIVDEIITQTNTEIPTEYLINNRTQTWNPQLTELLNKLTELKSNLETNSSQNVQANIESLNNLLIFFKQEKELITPISSKLDKALRKLRRKLDSIFVSINTLNVVMPTQGSLNHWEDFKTKFSGAKTSIRNAWPIIPNIIIDRAFNLERELNTLNHILLTIINNSRNLKGQHESSKTNVEKKQLIIEITKNLFAFGFQIAYGSLILNELPPLTWEFSDENKYKEGEEIKFDLVITPNGWPITEPKLKVFIDGEESTIEPPIESKGVHAINKYEYIYTIPGDGSIVSISVEKGGEKVEDWTRPDDLPQRVHKSFIINNPQNVVFSEDLAIDPNGKVTIQPLKDPNNTIIQIWLAPAGTTKFNKVSKNKSMVEGMAKDLKEITAPKNGGLYHLFVKDANGFISLESEKVLSVIVANFDADKKSICESLEVKFENTSFGAPDIFNWSFEKGTPDKSAEENPRIKYNTPGKHKVKLTVSKSGISDEMEQENYITVLPKPTASFEYTLTGKKVIFNNTSTNGESYKWNFGDGKESTNKNPVHTYEEEKTYQVVLEVINTCGITSTGMIEIKIKDQEEES